MFARCRKPYTTRMSSQEPQQKILPQSDSYCSIPNLKIERKICRRLLTSSFKREIRKFYVAVRVKETAKKCTKQCDTSTKLLFSLSDGGEGGRAVVLFSQFAPPPPHCFSPAAGLGVFYWKILHSKIHRCVFSISSPVIILMTSFPAFSRLVMQTAGEKWRAIDLSM